MGGNPYAPHFWCLNYLQMVFSGIVHLIWHLPGHHHVIESRELIRVLACPKGGLTEVSQPRRIMQTYGVAERAVIGLDLSLGLIPRKYEQVGCSDVQQS